MSSTHSKSALHIDSVIDVIRVIGRGATLGRTLTFSEAEKAGKWLMEGAFDDVQLGAFLMMLRLRGETADEVAGLVSGMKQKWDIPKHLSVDVDWPVYAGKRRQLPWFLVSSLILAKQGKRVLLHGAMGSDEDRLYVEPVIRAMGLPIAQTWEEVETALDQHSWVYIPMEVFFPQLANWLSLKQTLGLRSVMHTAARMLNPLHAPLSIRGVFHQEYVELHSQVAQLHHTEKVVIIRGDGGEAEVSADKAIPIVIIEQGEVTAYRSDALANLSRPIGEDLSLASVVTRLQAVLAGEAADEVYGNATIARTLTVISESCHR